jgi:hypothetical protein
MPAFLGIALRVPGASSLPSPLGTVPTIGCAGCLKCRWLPLIASQPTRAFQVSELPRELSSASRSSYFIGRRPLRLFPDSNFWRGLCRRPVFTPSAGRPPEQSRATPDCSKLWAIRRETAAPRGRLAHKPRHRSWPVRRSALTACGGRATAPSRAGAAPACPDRNHSPR